MKNLAIAGRALALDLASTIFFLLLYAATRNIVLAIALGVALAAGQIGWRLIKRQRVDALQWTSAALVLTSGTATLLTHNPTFVMLKPSLIYALVGCAMLQRGWMVRYMPPRALEFVPDLVVSFGFVWAGLMFLSAGLNLLLAFQASIIVWGSVMATWGIASKVALFLLQYAYLRMVGRHRARTRLAAASVRSALMPYAGG